MAQPLVSVLSENWLPIAPIGAECMRERGASSALPPIYFLHVWWARRPLLVCRAAILGGVLPVWHRDWPEKLLNKFPSQQVYEKWFLDLIGIQGDPVAARKRIVDETRLGIRTPGNKYGYPRAFQRSPDRQEQYLLYDLIEYAWGTRDILVCDPMAGGGSIPFEAMRYSFLTYANELNPVASVILKATLHWPGKLGPEFATELTKWGKILVSKLRAKLSTYFPNGPEETVDCYLWARTVACPVTGKPVPLSPNWWLQKGADPIAVRVIAHPEQDICSFEIVKGKAAIASKPDIGTVKKGVGRSPWTGDAIDGSYIKTEAQNGRMAQQLYLVRIMTNKGYVFRTPTEKDFAAVSAAEKELARRLPDWESRGWVPDTDIPAGNKTSEPLRYGMRQWRDMFSPRQLLSMLSFVEEMHSIRKEIENQFDEDTSEGLIVYLSFVLSKMVNYNSRMSIWHPLRNTIANTFDRHDFSFKWSHAEMAAVGSGKGFEWAVDQVADAFQGIAKIATSTGDALNNIRRTNSTLVLSNGSSANLSHITDESIHAITVDPPYYDNVMYAECSDFFYVWQKRIIGDLYPEWFKEPLTNKDDEAVANSARFDGAKNKRDLATGDYERKMTACFREMHRVLHHNGVLTVMFTHKKVEAWNTLATSLITAGFTIQTSWPVHTESEHSLHQAKKNSASSTILLVCRKRDQQTNPIWWDDIKGKVREEARSKARSFHAQGISGVDLYISSFGPVLSILSKNWPVLSSETDESGHPLPLRPEVALDIAREEVIALRKEELLHGVKVQFDPFTDWYLMAWDAFHAEQFPSDEARKLAIVLGLELEKDLISGKKIATKKSADVVLQQPVARKKKGLVDEESDSFNSWLDAAHTAMLVYEEDGSKACETFLKRSGLFNDSTFKLVLQAMINAIPRTRGKNDEFVRPEARTLDAIRLAFFTDLTTPPEEDLAVLASSPPLFVLPDEEDNDNAAEEEEGSEDQE